MKVFQYIYMLTHFDTVLSHLGVREICEQRNASMSFI